MGQRCDCPRALAHACGARLLAGFLVSSVLPCSYMQGVCEFVNTCAPGTMQALRITTHRFMRRTAFVLRQPSSTRSGHALPRSLANTCGEFNLCLRSCPCVHNAHRRGRKKGKRVYQFPNSLQLHIDREDRRIKDLTEGILYDFLPSALNVMSPMSDDVGSEFQPERCRVRCLC